MKKKIKVLVCMVLCVCIFSGFIGCAALDDAMNEFKGNLVGNGYTIRTYDNYGNRVMTTTGDKINITGNKVEETSYDSYGSIVTGYSLSSVITINVDGDQIQSCGDNRTIRSEEHTSELHSQSTIAYAVLCLKKNGLHGQLRRPDGQRGGLCGRPPGQLLRQPLRALPEQALGAHIDPDGWVERREAQPHGQLRGRQLQDAGQHQRVGLWSDV